MLSVQQQQQQFVPEIHSNENNFRDTEKDEDFYFFSQHLNSPGLLIDEEQQDYPADYFDPPTNFEIANRAFYATINKFTRQNCPDASRRRSPPYSFLENWLLHSIYSKSQQTLLGITPVRPSVLLSGDDFMFTPPFIQQEEQLVEEEDEEDEDVDGEESDITTDQDWNQLDESKSDYYSLSPCPDSNGTTTTGILYADEFETINYDKQFSNYYNHHNQQNIWLENEETTHNLDFSPLHIQQNHHLLLLQHDQVIKVQNDVNEQEDEEEELYTTDSSLSDEQRCSSEEEEDEYNISTLCDLDQDVNKLQSTIAPMTRSSSFLSQKSSSSSTSIISYQSLADIMGNINPLVEEPISYNYGSTTNNCNNPQQLLPFADSGDHQPNNYAGNYNNNNIIEIEVPHNVRTTHWELLVSWISKAIPCLRIDQEESEPLL